MPLSFIRQKLHFSSTTLCALVAVYVALCLNLGFAQKAWQVLDGLKPGDKLITEGLGKVVPDAPVMPQPAGQAPAAPASAAAH